MSPKHADKLAFLLVCCTIAAAFPFGCYPFSSIEIYSTWGDHPRAAEYPLVFKEGPKKGKEVLVAVFVSSAPGIDPAFARIEAKLASDIAKKLPEMAKESKPPQKLAVLDPVLVNKFKMKTPDWNRMHPSQWGKILDVDFVLDIHLDKMSFYQPGSLNMYYEGHAEVTVDTYDVDSGPGEPKYNYILPFAYPHTGMLSADSIPVNRFKRDYLEQLAAELCMKHIMHKQDLGIADGR